MTAGAGFDPSHGRRCPDLWLWANGHVCTGAIRFARVDRTPCRRAL